jgi:hypothetical protein
MEIQTSIYGIILNAVSSLHADPTFGPKLSNNQPKALIQQCNTHSLVENSLSTLLYKFEICPTVASATEFTHTGSIASHISSASLDTMCTDPCSTC